MRRVALLAFLMVQVTAFAHEHKEWHGENDGWEIRDSPDGTYMFRESSGACKDKRCSNMPPITNPYIPLGGIECSMFCKGDFKIRWYQFDDKCDEDQAPAVCREIDHE